LAILAAADEVLTEHQRAGIGSRLILALLHRLRAHSMIDLACGDDLVGLYERFGGRRGNAVVWRNCQRLRAPGEVAT
jgi:GNAT superfamily N-acetyltransferase